jgi:hypothetical protein
VSKTHRGTSHANERGSAEDRRRRRRWLVEHWPSDLGPGICRCYRCGIGLTVETVTVDRIIPGCQGGTYSRSNIRPSCLSCNQITGGHLGSQRRYNSGLQEKDG